MLLAHSRPIEPDPQRKAAQRATERQRQFEALYLRSHAEMRARTEPA